MTEINSVKMKTQEIETQIITVRDVEIIHRIKEQTRVTEVV